MHPPRSRTPTHVDAGRAAGATPRRCGRSATSGAARSRRHLSRLTLLALLALPCLPPSAAAGVGELIEQAIDVPVRVRVAAGPAVAQTIPVTIVREAAIDRRPFLVLQHGRPADLAGLARMGRQSYPANARYFAAQGFVVLVPTRVGYGLARGPDLEYTGECAFKRYAEGVEPAVSETRQVVEFAAQLPYVDAGHGIVVGESFGGLVAIAVAASGIPGVVAAINFAGGDGGDARQHADEPCRPDQLRETFAGYGRANRLPTLWMYGANDRFWGPWYPREWFAAFTRAGGRGQFVTLPAGRNDGHTIFNRSGPAWHPAFEAFATQLGLGSTLR